MVPAPEATQEAEKAKAKEKETAATHEGIGCDGCGTSPIVGIRYKCFLELETSCPNFDLCDKCMKRGVHPASHHMLPIVESDEAKFLNPAASEGTTTTVLGLRVYTQKSAPSVLEAQLRHGSLRTK
ncbi:hypothetical protein CPB86DRAFT_790172 [Serendipita vermifera]|nr:hypothetical protein CPB86DRAFT_790172 [Serendipita vermifera]